MLWDNPPHTCSTYTVTTSRDGGGGTANSYTLAQTGLPCLINTAGASEVERFAQQGITVTHTIGTKASLATTTFTRGMKVVDESGNSYHVRGIRYGRAFRGIAPLLYLDCEQQL